MSDLLLTPSIVSNVVHRAPGSSSQSFEIKSSACSSISKDILHEFIGISEHDYAKVDYDNLQLNFSSEFFGPSLQSNINIKSSIGSLVIEDKSFILDFIGARVDLTPAISGKF